MDKLKYGVFIGIAIIVSGSCSPKKNYSVSYNKIINFSGFEWEVKMLPYKTGPGPNFFSDDASNVWIDDQKRLHLKVNKRNNAWYSAEVVSREYFGYGKYIYTVDGRVDQLDKNIVFGMFTWDDKREKAHRELDIEFSRWGQETNANAQFVVQPENIPGHKNRFQLDLENNLSTHVMEWKTDSVLFWTYKGEAILPEKLVAHSVFKGFGIPDPRRVNVRFNLWLMEGRSPSNGQEAEVIISSLKYYPAPVIKN